MHPLRPFTAIVVTSLLLLMCCQGAVAETFKIGWIGPLTGPVAALGIDSYDVARALVKNANNARSENTPAIELIAEDDQYKTNQTVTAYTNVVRKGAKVIIVLTYGGVLAIAERAERDNVVIIDPVDCDEQLAALPKNIFCIAKKTEDLGIKNAQVVVRRKEGPTAILYADGDPFMPKVAQSMKAELEKNNVAVPVFEGLIGDVKDFRGSLTRAKNAGVKSVAFYGNEDYGLAMRQAREMGINAQYYSLTIIRAPGFKASADKSAEKAIVAGWFAPRTERFKNFLSDFVARNKREPILEVSTIPTYDIIDILKGFLSRSQNAAQWSDANEIRKYLHTVEDYDGLSGKITVDNDGAVRNLATSSYLYMNGEFVPLNE